MMKFAVYAKVRAGKREEFLAALRDYLPVVRNESQTLQYDVFESNESEGEFVFAEAYPDEAALKVHTGSDAFAAYMERIKPLLEGSPSGMKLVESV